ncbi:hypothetical protein [Streptomyces violarus]|uniref:hypothetical protein n=1 Tax=Streptomyces violarus TaxID=67380 RepID=UPI0021BEA530|nr:hypothetical protein [Streptomyces violarus]MCT9139744.1 hypothetical protein [Streptomyces violarus]
MIIKVRWQCSRFGGTGQLWRKRRPLPVAAALAATAALLLAACGSRDDKSSDLPTGDGLWQASKVFIEAAADKCQ